MLQVGSPAPDFTLKDQHGRAVTLSALRPRTVLLVFYPRTMWLSLRYPQRMMDYADTELGDVQSGQYTDTVSPPLFLMITLGLTYAVGLMLHSPQLEKEVPSLVSDPERMLVFRVFAFSMLPLFLSLRLLHNLDSKLDRDTLRPPFYSQCFVTAPFAMALGVGLTLTTTGGTRSVWFGVVLMALGTIWFIRQQAHWFSTKLGSSRFRGWTRAISTFLLAWAAIIAIVLVVWGTSQ